MLMNFVFLLTKRFLRFLSIELVRGHGECCILEFSRLVEKGLSLLGRPEWPPCFHLEVSIVYIPHISLGQMQSQVLEGYGLPTGSRPIQIQPTRVAHWPEQVAAVGEGTPLHDDKKLRT